MSPHIDVVNESPSSPHPLDGVVHAVLCARRLLAALGSVLIVFSLGASVVLVPAAANDDARVAARPLADSSAHQRVAGCGSSGAISRDDSRTNRESSATATAVRPAQSPHQSPITERCTKRPSTTATGKPIV